MLERQTVLEEELERPTTIEDFVGYAKDAWRRFDQGVEREEVLFWGDFLPWGEDGFVINHNPLIWVPTDVMRNKLLAILKHELMGRKYAGGGEQLVIPRPDMPVLSDYTEFEPNKEAKLSISFINLISQHPEYEQRILAMERYVDPKNRFGLSEIWIARRRFISQNNTHVVDGGSHSPSKKD